MKTTILSVSQKSRNKAFILLLCFCAALYFIPIFNIHYVAIPSFEQAVDFDEEELMNALKQVKPILTQNILLSIMSVIVKILAISAALYFARYLFPRFKHISFFEWAELVCISQAIFILYAIIMSAVRYFIGTMNVFDIESYLSLYTLFGNRVNTSIAWFETPLRSINILEMAFFLCLSIGLKIKTKASMKDSLLYVLLSYGSVFVLFVVGMLLITFLKA